VVFANLVGFKNEVLLQFSWRRGSKDSRGQGLKRPAFKGGLPGKDAFNFI
jgi:hypothetical protein